MGATIGTGLFLRRAKVRVSQAIAQFAVERLVNAGGEL
jgi:hypothetical protein